MQRSHQEHPFTWRMFLGNLIYCSCGKKMWTPSLRVVSAPDYTGFALDSFRTGSVHPELECTQCAHCTLGTRIHLPVHCTLHSAQVDGSLFPETECTHCAHCTMYCRTSLAELFLGNAAYLERFGQLEILSGWNGCCTACSLLQSTHPVDTTLPSGPNNIL